MASERLTKAQAGKLGGLAAARSMTPAERAERSHKSGTANLEKNGREFYVRAAHKRWGRLQKKKGAKTETK